MGTGSGQTGPYAPSTATEHAPENGTYGGGGPPPGFTGMASPYYQQSGGNAGKLEVSRGSFNFTVGCRIAALLLSVLAVGLVASANKTQAYYSSASDYGSLNYKALRVRSSKFLVSMGVIVLVYELVSVILSCLDRTRAVTFMSNSSGLLATFVADQLLAYLVFAADATLAGDAARWRHGDGTFGSSCEGWNSWCSQVEAGVAMGILAFGALAAVAIVSGARFNKLS